MRQPEGRHMLPAGVWRFHIGVVAPVASHHKVELRDHIAREFQRRPTPAFVWHSKRTTAQCHKAVELARTAQAQEVPLQFRVKNLEQLERTNLSPC